MVFSIWWQIVLIPSKALILKPAAVRFWWRVTEVSMKWIWRLHWQRKVPTSLPSDSPASSFLLGHPHQCKTRCKGVLGVSSTMLCVLPVPLPFSPCFCMSSFSTIYFILISGCSKSYLISCSVPLLCSSCFFSWLFLASVFSLLFFALTSACSSSLSSPILTLPFHSPSLSTSLIYSVILSHMQWQHWYSQKKKGTELSVTKWVVLMEN